MNMLGRLLGIDHGIQRIGLAVSDANRIIATEWGILERTTRQADFDRLNQLIHDEGIVAIVIGIPNNEASDGTYTQADTVRLWIQRFSQTMTLPIVEWDEQLSSEDAHELATLKGRKARDPVDDLAARIILQSYLDALHDGLAQAPILPEQT